jgi:hypothetical protein
VLSFDGEEYAEGDSLSLITTATVATWATAIISKRSGTGTGSASASALGSGSASSSGSSIQANSSEGDKDTKATPGGDEPFDGDNSFATVSSTFSETETALYAEAATLKLTPYSKPFPRVLKRASIPERALRSPERPAPIGMGVRPPIPSSPATLNLPALVRSPVREAGYTEPDAVPSCPTVHVHTPRGVRLVVKAFETRRHNHKASGEWAHLIKQLKDAEAP